MAGTRRSTADGLPLGGSAVTWFGAVNIGIYVYQDAEVLDFAGPYEVFATAARLDRSLHLAVFLIGESGAQVLARNGFAVQPQYSIAGHPPLEVLVVPGGVHTGELNKQPVIDWIAGQALSLRWIASVCTGAFLLARAGLLDGRRVTTHWEDIADLRRDFPMLEVVENTRWVEDGNRITSAGIAAGIDMSLYLLSRVAGVELARTTARQMEYPWLENASQT